VQTKEGTWLSHLLDKFRIHHSFLFLCNVARYIQSTCATSGEGLYEGLDWLSTNIVKVIAHQRMCKILFQWFLPERSFYPVKLFSSLAQCRDMTFGICFADLKLWSEEGWRLCSLEQLWWLESWCHLWCSVLVGDLVTMWWRSAV
jgi:hypothetical protein